MELSSWAARGGASCARRGATGAGSRGTGGAACRSVFFSVGRAAARGVSVASVRFAGAARASVGARSAAVDADFGGAACGSARVAAAAPGTGGAARGAGAASRGAWGGRGMVFGASAVSDGLASGLAAGGGAAAELEAAASSWGLPGAGPASPPNNFERNPITVASRRYELEPAERRQPTRAQRTLGCNGRVHSDFSQRRGKPPRPNTALRSRCRIGRRSVKKRSPARVLQFSLSAAPCEGGTHRGRRDGSQRRKRGCDRGTHQRGLIGSSGASRSAVSSSTAVPGLSALRCARSSPGCGA
jgi:hypothetical protein